MDESRGVCEAATRRSAIHRCERSANDFPSASEQTVSSDVTYRLAREDDLSAMRLIQSKALYDLVVTRGGAPPSAISITDEPSSEMRHLLRTDPKLAWLAIEDGRPIGLSVGFVRDELWFLADLFVLPEAHSKGVGGELLKRCLAGGGERGARILAVASSHDLGAQTLYVRAGMVPRFPLYGILGDARGLLELPTVSDKIRKIEPSRSWIRKLGDLDEIVWGRRRDGDHRFWMEESKSICLAITDPSGKLLAYAYYGDADPSDADPCRIGPVAARTARHQLSLLRAIGEGLSGHASATVEFRVPGINMTILSALLRAGFKIDHIGHFMASRSFGRFDRYLPSGGTLL
jgi:GNAT superfamily N-acetyltransferase